MNTDQDEIATTVEALLPRFGRVPEPRTPRDESHRGGLHVDYTFDAPEYGPPLALEVTTLRNRAFVGGTASLAEVADRLSAISEREQLGNWTVEVEGTRARWKALEPVVVELIRAGRQVRVGDPVSDDERAEHEGWAAQGLMSVQRATGSSNRVELAAWESPTASSIGGFTDLLVIEIEANATKLASARQGRRETHLAVEVHRFDASRYPHLTDPPALPDAMDMLWVLFRWHRDDRLARVWSVRRGDTHWGAHNI